MASEGFSEKMILTVESDIAIANEKLLELKVYFIENPTLRILEEKLQIYPFLEKVGDYYIVEIKPVSSLKSRNMLLLALKKLYPNTLAINNHKINIPHKNMLSKQVVEDIIYKNTNILPQKKSIDNLWDTLELQWIVIWLLAVIGLLLSIWNRRKISNLNDTQNDIRSDQKKIESEIKQLGT
jgi:hypothetical protein